ncbi:aminopeptidase [Allokutzneria albata]|uniref:Leucyl aminopeptidase (Aminopeptidase T) n=1 Tax=Allokutzneria albata TaxID=211114 RepID=A0A1G9TST8_ALLAB|nr:aminopeptidase [Allokutzneria albata]SDM50651.1 Leucyl aminopeptidase (aminopeptidase T) [Allokutzneria albata]
MSWSQVAVAAVNGIAPPPGGLVVVRDRCGRPDAVNAVVVELERRGVTAVVDAVPDEVFASILRGAEPELIEHFGTHRAAMLERADGVISLGAQKPDFEGVEPEVLQAFLRAREVMGEVEARRRLPFLVVAVPTSKLAREVGWSMAELDEAVLPAIAADRRELADAIERATAELDGPRWVLESPGCLLTADRDGRELLSDDGHVSEVDRARGATTSNLPAGSVYSTVVEESVRGTVRLQGDVVLTFADGRVTDGPEHLRGERVSHIGIGLNPAARPVGWVINDEHQVGAVFLALGDNRYLGGRNASTLNEDFVVDRGRLGCR